MADFNVLDRNLTEPPGSPADGDQYIVAVGATGAWAGWDNSVAHYTEGTWERIIPSLEQTAVVADEAVTLVYKGSPLFWVLAQYWRERLTGPRTYYVRAAGSDVTGDGLTVGTAFNTPSKAIEVAAALDTSGFDVEIDVKEARTLTATIVLLPLLGGGIGSVIGLNSSGSTVLNVVGAHFDALGGTSLGGVGEWFLDNLRLIGTGRGIYAKGNTQIEIGAGMDFACADNQIQAGDQSFVFARNGYKISGGGAGHVVAYYGGTFLIVSGTVTLTGTPNFTFFAQALAAGLITLFQNSGGFSGSATGQQFSAASGGVIINVPAGAVPGNINGVTDALSSYHHIGASIALAPLRNNFVATSDPTSSDDATNYYSVGSRWVNTTEKRAWTCVTATAGAAVWKLDGGAAVAVETSKNPLINNRFQIWQRGTSFANPASLSYHADRWQIYFNGTGATRTISRQAHTLGDELMSGGSRYFLRWAETVAGSGSTSKHLYSRVPGVATLAGKVVRPAMLARAAANLSLNDAALIQNFGTGGSPTTQKSTDIGTPAITTSWQFLLFSAVLLPDLTDVTLGTNGDDYLQFWLGLPPAATFTFDIAGAWIVEDGAPLPSMAASFEEDLARCLPFFERLGGDTANDHFGRGYANSTVQGHFDVFYTPKRAIPTITIQGTVGTDFELQRTGGAVVAPTAIAATAAHISKRGTQVGVSVASGLTAGEGLGFKAKTTSGLIDVSAEL